MLHTSQLGALLATLTLSAAFIVCTASALPIHVQYEVYNDQQAAPRDQQPASDLQTVASQQTPSELQSHGAPHQSSQDQPQANEQPASSEQKGEQASAPPPTPEQPNAFVSGKSDEPQDVAQTEPQSSEQSNAQGEPAEQKSPEQKSEPPASQSQQAPPTETKSGEEYDPYNP